MALWHDPLDELIAELERALPAEAQPGRFELLPRLEDLQAVLTPLLFAPRADQQRIFADPQYQHLYNTVMRQLTHREQDPTWIDEVPVPRELKLIDPEPERVQIGHHHTRVEKD